MAAGPIETDRTVLRLAGPRGGICTRAALLAGGLTESTVDNRVRAGLLRLVGRGVYAIDELAGDTTPLHLALAVFPEAVISHTTAAALHGLAIDPSTTRGPVHVNVPAPIRRRVKGAVTHPRRTMPDGDDVEALLGLPVTSAARTIVDLAAIVGPARLRHIVHTGVRDNNPSLIALMASFQASARRGVSGIAGLRRVLNGMTDHTPVNRSALEAARVDLLAAGGLTGWIAQYRPP